MKIMMKCLLVKILLFVSFLILTTSGCDKRKACSDPVSDYLRWIVNQSGDRVNMRQRAQLAMSKWQDGVTDPEPFLIDVAMMTVGVEDGERMHLVLVIYDEDADYIGCVVEEEYVDSNGVMTTLVEKYPVYTHLDRGVVCFSFVPVLLRDKNQRKSEEQWQKYVSTPLQQIRKEYMKRLKKTYWSWRDSLPQVWVSIPEPNKVYVRLRAYDRAGHQSEQMNLVYEP
jgi:hypothetical protein